MKLKQSPLVLLSLVFAASALAADLNPKLMSEWPQGPTGWVSDIAVRGTYAYVGGPYVGGRHVMDISDPTTPRRFGVSTVNLNGSTKFSGNYAYVAAAGAGLLVYDVTDPVNPRRISSLDTAGSASDVAIVGNFAYVVDTISNGVLHAINISDPKRPVEVGTYALDARAINVEVSGNHAFVLGWPFLPTQEDQWTLDCFDISNPAQIKRIGQIQKAGYLLDSPGHSRMVVSGDYAYISALHYDLNYASVEVVDLRDPANPKWVTSYKNNSRAGSLAVSGNYLHLTKTSLDYRSGLDILDISNPAGIRKLGTYFGTQLEGVAVAGTQAYIANGGRFEVLDISNPASPRRTGSWMPPIGAMDVAHAGSLTYSVGSLGLTTYLNIVDTSDPSNPQPMGSLSVAGWAQRIKLLGNYAYIVTERGLHVVDVTDPKAPKRTGGFTAQHSVHDVAFASDYAFVADQDAGLQLLTITNAASPRRLATFLASSTEPVYGVCVSSNLAFVFTQSWQGPSDTWYSKANIFDITDPRTPTTLSSYEASGVLVRGAVAGSYLYLTKRYKQDSDRGWWGGMLEILDITDPANPQPISQYETTGEPSNITVSGGRAYVTCRGAAGGPSMDGQNGGGLNIIDVSDPAHPRRMGGFQGSTLNGISVEGNLAYAGGGHYGGLQILDLNKPAALSRVAGLDTTDHASGLALAGNQLLVADRLAGMQVVDVSNPVSPKLTTTIAPTEPVWGVAVSGSTAYAASGGAGVQSFDLTDPANPQPLGVHDTPGQARGITISGQYAYVADGEAGLQILAVGNPGSMLPVGSVETTGFANSVALMGNYALVADWENGLVVVDVSNPQTPHIVGNYNTGGYTLAVGVVGSNALISDELGGFQIVDLSKPAEPKVLGSAPSDGWARSIAVSGRFAYVADASTGVQVYDISDLSHPRRVGGTSAVDPYGVLMAADQLYVASGRDGLSVLSPFTPPLDVTASPTQTPGSISLRVDGPPGSSVRIQRSSDLMNWENWQTLTLGEVPATVTDTVTARAPGGFYRAVSP